MSWKTELKCGSEWSSNSLRFSTEAEAIASGKELMSRWFVPTAARAVISTDSVNYLFDFAAGKNVRVEASIPV